jgi:hypothetical protein
LRLGIEDKAKITAAQSTTGSQRLRVLGARGSMTAGHDRLART